MKLYYMKGACSLASYISLIEAGIKFEGVEVDHGTHKTKDGQDIAAISSKGYVPVLRLDTGEILTENVAVLQYIASLNPAAKLAPPPGTFEYYKMVEWLAYVNSEVHKNFGPLFNPAASQDIRNSALDNLKKRLGWLNSALGSKKYLMGEQFTVADAYLYVVLTWAGHVRVDLTQWAALQQHNARVAARPAAVAARKAEGLE